MNTGSSICSVPDVEIYSEDRQESLSPILHHFVCDLKGIISVSQVLQLTYSSRVFIASSSMFCVLRDIKVLCTSPPRILFETIQDNAGTLTDEKKTSKLQPKKLKSFGKDDSKFWKFFFLTTSQIEQINAMFSDEHRDPRVLKFEVIGCTPNGDIQLTMYIRCNTSGRARKPSNEVNRIDKIGILQEKCRSNYIVRFYAFWASQKYIYQVFEKHTCSLETTFNNSVESLAEPQAKKICRDVLQALALLHGRGITHGDISMKHIFYDSENDVYKLGGFEAAQEHLGSYEPFGKDITHLGVVLFELLSSTRLFSNRLLNGDLAPILQLPSGLMSSDGSDFLWILFSNVSPSLLITADDLLDSSYLS